MSKSVRAAVIGVDYETLLDDLHACDRIVIGDGAITLDVEKITSTGADCRVRSGGHTQGRPGVHLPSDRLRITDADTTRTLRSPRRWQSRAPTSSLFRSCVTADDLRKPFVGR